MPRYFEEIDDAEFLSPEILRVADTPSPVKPLPTSSYAAALSTSDRIPPRTSLHSQFAAMQPHPSSISNPFKSATSPASSSSFTMPSSTFVPPVSSSTASRSSPYFARPPPLASAMDAPTLSDFFGNSPRGMTAIITRDTLSPQKQPPISQRAPASSDAAQPLSGAAQWRGKMSLSLPAATRLAAHHSSAPSSLGRSDEVIDLAGDDDRHITDITSPTAANTSAPSSLSSLTAHSEKQLYDLLQSPNKSHSTKQRRKSSKPPKHLHVTIQLVAPSTVGISAQPDDQRVTDIVRNVSGAVWDEKRRMWTCRVSAVNALISRFEALGTEESEVTVEAPDERLLADERRRETGLPAAAARESGEEKQEVKDYEWWRRLDAKLRRALYPFQRDGVDFALQHEGKVLIGDEMGLGKTLQGIAIASLYYQDWPCLIVCPSSLRLNWKNELTRWLPKMHSREIQIIMSGKDRLLHRALHWTTKFTIISYDLVIKSEDCRHTASAVECLQLILTASYAHPFCRACCCRVHRFEPSIKKANYGCIICDESHYLKSLTAKRTRALLPILKRTKRCILLSGTPALSRPIELYNQISVLSDKFGSYHDFGVRYAKARKGRFGWEYKGAANLAELHFLLKQHVMIRRLKEEVLTELRPKQRTAVMVSIDDREVEARCKRLIELKEMANTLVNSADGAAAPLSGFTQEKRNELFEMYRKTGEAKLSSIIQYIADLLENNLKFLVFAHHLSVLDGVEEFLKKNRYAYFRLDGSTSPMERQRGVDWFQSDANCKVALLSITAGGTGLTLTASSTVVFAELAFTPALLLQAEDRVHRIGQPNAVNIHYLLGRHSLDDLLWPLLVRKMAVVGSSLDGQEAELEFQGIRGDEGEQDKARFNVGQKGMARWLEKDEQRKTEAVQRDAALRQRRELKWRNAIEIGDEQDEAGPPAAEFTEAEGLSADREAELDEEVQDSMWVYVSDEEEKNFIVDDDEEEVEEDDGEAEAEFKEDKEDDEHDEDERFDSDEDYEQSDDGRDEQADDDDDEGEAEYQPKTSRGKKRVLRSDDELDEAEGEDELKELLSNNSLTPLSSSSSYSCASASQPKWAGPFGSDRRSAEQDSRLEQVRRARQQARQKELRKRQKRDAVVEEEDHVDAPYARRKPSAASRSARDNPGRRREGEEQQEAELEEGEEEVEAGGSVGAQYNESDLSVMLLGMGYTAGQVQSVLDELRDDKDEEQLYDVHTALELLVKKGHKQPVAQRVDERKEAAEESESVPCERCGSLVSFYDYTTHLGQCRRPALNLPTSQPDQSTTSSKHSAHYEEQKAAAVEQPLQDEAEEDEEVEEQVRVKPAADRRRRIIDLEDEEELEEQIVTSQEKRSADEDVSVQDEVSVEWLEE